MRLDTRHMHENLGLFPVTAKQNQQTLLPDLR